MAIANQPEHDESDTRLADLMIRIEGDRAFKLTPIAIARVTGLEAHILVGFNDRSRIDLTPAEALLAALMVRLERPYPEYEEVARRLEAASTAADLAEANLARGYAHGVREIAQPRVVPA